MLGEEKNLFVAGVDGWGSHGDSAGCHSRYGLDKLVGKT